MYEGDTYIILGDKMAQAKLVSPARLPPPPGQALSGSGQGSYVGKYERIPHISTTSHECLTSTNRMLSILNRSLKLLFWKF